MSKVRNFVIRFQSTPPVKAATRIVTAVFPLPVISIHAAREGGDRKQGKRHTLHNTISIHAAREGGDRFTASCTTQTWEFQSTPPVKAATMVLYCYDSVNIFQSTPPVKAATCLLCVLSVLCYISIHAAREGGDLGKRRQIHYPKISIHAAREGGDNLSVKKMDIISYFNPRRP